MRTTCRIEAGVIQISARVCRRSNAGTFGFGMTTAMMRLGSVARTILQDVRYGARNVAQVPGFTAVAVLTLALASGQTPPSSVSSMEFFLRPLPYSSRTVCRHHRRFSARCRRGMPSNLKTMTRGYYKEWNSTSRPALASRLYGTRCFRGFIFRPRGEPDLEECLSPRRPSRQVKS